MASLNGCAPRISVVILTWNRQARLEATLETLQPLADCGAEIIVVDNGSQPGVAEQLDQRLAFAKVITIPENLGTGSRNSGIRAATNDVVVCLDDDVSGLTPADQDTLCKLFDSDDTIGAVCFKVTDEADPDKLINWCHDYSVEEFGQIQFVTDEITEGAVALRRSAIIDGTMFPGSFFISHEGVAVAYQIMNAGLRVIYDPRVVVQHATAPEGRKSWRRYYYDTRNNLLLVAGYFPVWRGLRRLTVELTAMLIYSIRDGFFRYWAKGVFDGLRGLPAAWRARQPPSAYTRSLLRSIDRFRPSLIYKAKARLFRKGVRI